MSSTSLLPRLSEEILALLAKSTEPMSGNQLGLSVNPDQPAVAVNALKRLERQGLVVYEVGNTFHTKLWSLTSKGQQLADLLARW